jgi:hypothetical protein
MSDCRRNPKLTHDTDSLHSTREVDRSTRGLRSLKRLQTEFCAGTNSESEKDPRIVPSLESRMILEPLTPTQLLGELYVVGDRNSRPEDSVVNRRVASSKLARGADFSRFFKCIKRPSFLESLEHLEHGIVG